MNVTREQISVALFTLLTPVSAGYKMTSRKFKLWNEVAVEDKPAFFLIEHDEDQLQPGRGIPGKTTLGYAAFIYIGNSPEDTTPGIIQLNNLLDNLDANLATRTPGGANGEAQTLGGLVSHCWREGRTLKDPGDLDGFGFAMAPLRVLVP